MRKVKIDMLFGAIISILLAIMAILVLVGMIVDTEKLMYSEKDAVQKEKSSESKVQQGKVKEIKINESKAKITLDNGLTFEDTKDLSKHVDAHDKIGYVKYRDYQATKDGLKKGNIKYKVKNIEK